MNARHFFSLILISLLTIPLQAGGIKFFQGSWEEALQQAKKEKKVVFVDAYTDWCGPCKAMSRNTFPNEEVGAFFNKNFINYKFNMEKGDGPQFAVKYKVAAYPTLLFINYQGDVVHKSLGYKAPKQLLAEGQRASSPKINQATLELGLEDGSASPADLLNVAYNQKEAGKDYDETITKYFATQEEKALLETRNWKAIQSFTSDANSREFQYVMDKRKKFVKQYGEKAVNDLLYTVLARQLREGIGSGTSSLVQQALSKATTLKDDGAIHGQLKILRAELNGDWDDYAFKVINHFDKFPVTDPKVLDHAARNFSEHISDPAKLNIALNWARQSTALDNQAYNNETYARLFYRLGKQTNALRYANKALQIRMLNEEDTEDLRQLIEEIQGM